MQTLGILSNGDDTAVERKGGAGSRGNQTWLTKEDRGHDE